MTELFLPLFRLLPKDLQDKLDLVVIQLIQDEAEKLGLIWVNE